MNNFQRALKHKNSSSIDEKIAHLDEMMVTTGMYSVVKQTDGIEEEPPTYGEAPLGDYDPDNFSWPDQGDGSDADANPVTTGLTVTDTLGREISTFDYLPGVTYSGWSREPDYSIYGGKKPLAILYDTRALASTRYLVLYEDGVNQVWQDGFFTTPAPYSAVTQAVADWVRYADKSNITTKTIYIWGSMQSLFGTKFSASQYYPAGSDWDSDPQATRGLYAYTMYVPRTGNTNYATDPGVRTKPPVVSNVISRDNLGDPNYFPGNPLDFLMGLLDLGKQGLDYILGAADDFLSGDPLVDAINDIFGDVGNFFEPLSALNFAGDAFQAFLSQQIGLVNYTEDDPKEVDMPPQDKQALSDAVNDVMQTIPREDWENLSDEQLAQVNDVLSPDTGPTPTNPDRPEGERKDFDEYHLIFNNIGRNDAFAGEIKTDENGNDYVAGINDTYVYTNDADASVTGAPELIKFFAQAFGAQDRIGDTPYEYVGTSEKGAYDAGASVTKINLKNMPIHMDLPAPNTGTVTKESFIISEEWQSPKHTGIQKDMKKRFFDPKDIAPEYPKKNPEPMNGGYNSKSTLAPKKLSRDPVIKLTKKDLSRNHRLTKKEVKDMMDTINKINKFLDANPAELIHARIRYPKDDPRLAELNWKLDQQLSASNEYLDKRFPENKQQTARVKKILARNIELTDPRTFKSVKQPVTYEKMFKGEDPNKRIRLKDYSKKSPARFFKTEKKKDTSRLRWLKG